MRQDDDTKEKKPEITKENVLRIYRSGYLEKKLEKDKNMTTVKCGR